MFIVYMKTVEVSEFDHQYSTILDIEIDENKITNLDNFTVTREPISDN